MNTDKTYITAIELEFTANSDAQAIEKLKRKKIE